MKTISSCIAATVLALGLMSSSALTAETATETVIYSFKGGADGNQPIASLIADNGGTLYGTTRAGGTGNCDTTLGGCGTVFKLTPARGSWTEAVLYRFCSQPGCSDGAQPYASLITDSQGALYGTTYSGGTANAGTVFKLTPTIGGSWKETVLYSFCSSPNCVDGSSPQSVLLFDNGELYGTTSTGGSANLGTVFKLTQTKDKLAWTETVVHSFSGPTAGGDATPVAGLIEHKGVFYGTTTFTIFKLTSNGVETTLNACNVGCGGLTANLKHPLIF